VASRNAKTASDSGKGVGETGLAVYLDFRDAIKRDGEDAIALVMETFLTCTKELQIALHMKSQ
jgi:hypothetical protein